MSIVPFPLKPSALTKAVPLNLASPLNIDNSFLAVEAAFNKLFFGIYVIYASAQVTSGN